MSQRTSGPRGLFSRAEHKVNLSDDEILSDTRFIRSYRVRQQQLPPERRTSWFLLQTPETRKRNSCRLACSVPSRRPRVHRAVSTSAGRSNQQFSRA